MSYNLDPQKKVLAVSLLSEGSSIRSVERVTAKDAKAAMKEFETEAHWNVDWVWDETAGPCLDRIAEIVKQVAANPTNKPEK